MCERFRHSQVSLWMKILGSGGCSLSRRTRHFTLSWHSHRRFCFQNYFLLYHPTNCFQNQITQVLVI